MKTKETIGITLISLVVTIVVLMILAGVSINTILGDNGIIKKSQESANLTKETEAKEIMNRVVLEYYLVKKGETFEEFLQSKIPNTIDSVTKNEDGTFTISKNGYTLTVEEKRENTSDNDKRMEGELTLSEYSGEYVYPNSGTFSITKSTGTVSVESSNENIAKVEISGNTVTIIPGTTEGRTRIIVTSASNEKYKEKTAIYEATVKNGEIELSVTPYSGMYDGQVHKALTSVNVIPSDANKEYSIDGENYDATIPTISEISTITVYVRASKVGYQTKTITCTAQVEDNTFTGTSAIGYYADVDGNGTVDGVIFSDAGSSNKKSYCVSQTNYSGDFGTKDVLKANGTGNTRFSVMALSDAFSSAVQLSSIRYGIGSNNGWYTPDKEEWVQFANALSITSSNYKSYKLSPYYWTSSGSINSDLWYWYDFRDGNYSDQGKTKYEVVDDYNYVRLCKSF